MGKAIVVRIWEGIGNQLFQYAYALSLKNKGYEVYLDLNKSFDDSFAKYRHNSSRENAIQNYSLSISEVDENVLSKYNFLSRKTRKEKIVFWMATHGLWKYKFWEEKVQHYQDKSRNITPECYVKGWFQSEDYFKDIADLVRNDIQLNYEINIPLDLKEAIESHQSISIHIRRGDYVKLHHELGLGYFSKAIDYLNNILPNANYIVFSDDIDWVKNNLNLPKQSTKYIDNSYGLQDFEELILMSKCSAHIISNSTFSWWGAWLDSKAEKKVIAPRKWLSGQENIVPKEWIII